MVEADLLAEVLFPLCFEEREAPVCGQRVGVAMVLTSELLEVVGVEVGGVDSHGS